MTQMTQTSVPLHARLHGGDTPDASLASHHALTCPEVIPLRLGLCALVLTRADAGPPTPPALEAPEDARRRRRAAAARRFRRSMPKYYGEAAR